jgi:hypothetical protein
MLSKGGKTVCFYDFYVSKAAERFKVGTGFNT